MAAPELSPAMSCLLPAEPTGFVTIDNGPVAYWRIGTPGGPPLICLHGGPGLPHSYLEPLAALGDRREVVFYDQSGCGRSTRSKPRTGWTISHFVHELAQVVQTLDFAEFHLFGNSWGGWLALEYILNVPHRPPTSLVLSSVTPSVATWLSGVARLRDELPADVKQVLDHNELEGTTSSRDYRAALARFNSRHMCRTRPRPQPLVEAIAGFGDAVYAELWGPSEFGPVTGALRDWDVTAQLPEISVPTLVTVGRYDEALPEHAVALAAGIPEARLRIFEQSSHMAFLEEEAQYCTEVSSFLRDVEIAREDIP